MARFVLPMLEVRKREPTSTAVIGITALMIVSCASAPSPRVPAGGISVARAGIPGSRRWWSVYTKDGERIDLPDLPEAIADNEQALKLASTSRREARVAEVAAFTGWPLLMFATPACELASRNEGRTVHEVIPLTTAAIGVAGILGTVVFGLLSSSHLRRAVRVFNESRPTEPPPAGLDSPHFIDGPICPIGADC